MSHPFIAIHDLDIFFKTRESVFSRRSSFAVISRFSLTLAKDETFCLIGESGSGKTTLAFSLLGLHPFQKGFLIFDGNRIQKPNDRVHSIMKSRTQVVFQDPKSSLNPYLPLMKSLEEPLAAKGVSREERMNQLKELIVETGLTEELLRRLPSEVSGGENQRVCIARALSTRPDFLILDEPLTSLDAVIRKKTASLLRRMKEKYRFTCFMITHDMALVKTFGDRVGVMYLGRLVETAPKDVFLEKPAHPYSRALLSTAFTPGVWSGKRIVLKGDIPSIQNPPGGCVFHTRCPVRISRCFEEVPRLLALGPGHTVSCHLFEDRGKEAL